MYLNDKDSCLIIWGYGNRHVSLLVPARPRVVVGPAAVALIWLPFHLRFMIEIGLQEMPWSTILALPRRRKNKSLGSVVTFIEEIVLQSFIYEENIERRPLLLDSNSDSYQSLADGEMGQERHVLKIRTGDEVLELYAYKLHRGKTVGEQLFFPTVLERNCKF
ncbi:hypothetical protein ANCCAN_12828 [Ancylostoma caninum]|uniref:Uncharacterized protein n=1 Tax=Ancylostoma caninum TaxID=29170 RepID=A0A368GA25_ANCCA|nr:hypothetical protein ANCCAN_12828 [Ancylostoma caninum]